jgi:hypothetical protein
VVLLNALMGLPPVVVGLGLYLLLSRAGPLGALGLLYTPTAMVLAQGVLVLPIIAALTQQTIADLYTEYDEQLRSLGVGPGRALWTLLWDGRTSLLTAILAGFCRASAEVWVLQRGLSASVLGSPRLKHLMVVSSKIPGRIARTRDYRRECSGGWQDCQRSRITASPKLTMSHHVVTLLVNSKTCGPSVSYITFEGQSD